MPRIALVAMFVFSIPASTAAVERPFSSAGNLINRKGPRLLESRAAKMLFGHENVVRGYDGKQPKTQYGVTFVILARCHAKYGL